MGDLVSIIVPVYNVEKYLRKCIDNLVGQTYKNLEIILIDDGSTDNCGNICDCYANVDIRVKCYHKKNGGLSDARNYGLDRCNGKYVMFVDSDDYLDTKCVEALYSLIKKNNANISVCSFYYETEFGETINTLHKNMSIDVLDRKQGIVELLRMEKYSNSAWGKLYQKELFESVRFPKGRLFEDIPTTYKIFLKAEKIVYSPEAYYHYLYRCSAISKQKDLRGNIDAIEFTEEMTNKILDIYPDLAELCSCRLISAYAGIIAKADIRSTVYTETVRKIKIIRKQVYTYSLCPKRRRIIALASYFPNCIFKIVCQKIS